MAKTIQVYSGIDRIPTGRTSGKVTEGTLLIEGGAWRGIYTQGALDAMMEADITLRTTIGVSAGAMSAVGYVSGQIGWAPRINLTYRQDPNYCGTGAMKRDHGITGFSYLFTDLMKNEMPIDRERFFDPARRLIVVATHMVTGEPTYFEKGKCRIFHAIRASATVPEISRPVVMECVPYLDGGCSVHIPYRYAKEHFPGKTVVLRTRDRSFRAKEKKISAAEKVLYAKYPAFLEAMVRSDREYNEMLDEMDQDEREGKTFVLAPENPITIGHFESDMEVLGGLYWDGYYETKERIPELLEYLHGDEEQRKP